MSDQTCSTCRCWDRLPDDGTGVAAGLCRRRAPAPATPTAEDESDHAWPVWPRTLAAEWCGDWRPRPVAQQPDPEAELRLLREEMAEAVLQHGSQAAEVLRLRAELIAAAALVDDLREQLALAEVDCANAGATATARVLRRIAEGQAHVGTFGGAEVEAAARAVQGLRAQRDAAAALAEDLRAELAALHGPLPPHSAAAQERGGGCA